MESENLFKIVGNNIRNIRITKGLSQFDLSVKVEGDIDYTNISRIEQGRTNPTLLTLYRISKALEVPLIDLFSEVDSENTNNRTK